MSSSGTRRGTGWRVQSALEDTEAALLSLRSAARLRASSQQDQARRAERSAAWARFDLDDPLVARQLYAAVNLRDIQGLGRWPVGCWRRCCRSRVPTAATCSWLARS
jgi:hypothetical protein